MTEINKISQNLCIRHETIEQTSCFILEGTKSLRQKKERSELFQKT